MRLEPGARWTLGLILLAIVVTFVPARAATSSTKKVATTEKPRARVGLVFDVGGRGDKSFNDAAFLGVSRAETELGVEASYLEPSSTEDREAALRLFAARGFDIVIGVGFIFSSDIDAVAKAYPNIRFAGVDYAPSPAGIPPNVAALAFREEEGSFLVGAVAGLMSKSGHVGFVGGMTGPLIRKFEVGYIAGVEAACPSCKVHASYAGTTPDAFRDPAKGKALANAEIAAGSDVIYHASGSTGHGVFEAASDAHAFAIGVDADQYDEMPGTVITSMIKRGDVAVFDIIRDVLEGRFKGGMRIFGLADNAVDYVHEGPHAAAIPDDVKAKVQALRADVIAGRVVVRVDDSFTVAGMAFVHGGRLVAQALKRHGTTHLFTLCGGHIQAIYDGCLDENIRVVDVRHEQTAGHAADGYARVTGRPGVCAVTAGPGVTDVVTAIANAQRAQIPLICIGGAGPKLLCDMGSLQDMDHVALMRPITKWAVQVPETRRIAEYIDAAFRVAQANVPGPVFLEMPLDLLMNMHEDTDLPATRPLEEPPRPGADPRLVTKAIDLLKTAKKPCFLVGSQVRWSPARDRIAAVLERFGAPVYLNGMARGTLPHAHPLLFSRSRRFALSQADVVFVLGTPFDFRVDYGRTPTWNEGVKIVQIDLDGSELGRNRRVDVAVHGDSGVVLEQLARELADTNTKLDLGEWVSAVRADEDKRRAKMQTEIESNESPPNPLRVCHELGKRLKPNDIVIGDGGDFVATAAYVLKLQHPQLWMDPGPLGTLGVGPGYAMAAKLARPDANVVLVYGDGSFGLHGIEFEAMARQDIPVIALIGNDAGWTQIRRGQVDIYGVERAVATALDYTRYDKIVEACGGRGFWVEKVEELGPALDEAFACQTKGKPACINVKIAKSDFRKGSISV